MVLGSEIDILAWHRSFTEIWLVEVKTRSNVEIIHPSHAVSWRKYWRMLRAGEWLLDHWQAYVVWHTQQQPSSSNSQITWQHPISLVFPKSARFAIISVFGNQIEWIDASDW